MADPTAQPTTSNPGFVDALRQAAQAIGENLKTRFGQGPPTGQLGAASGSVLGDKNAQLQMLSPTPGGYSSAAQSPVANPTLSRQQLPYGSYPGEQRIDTTEMIKPLGGLSGVRRNAGPNGGI